MSDKSDELYPILFCIDDDDALSGIQAINGNGSVDKAETVRLREIIAIKKGHQSKVSNRE